MSKVYNIFPNKKIMSGLPEGLDAKYLLDKIKTEQKSLIHVARDDSRALALKKAIEFFDPSVPVLNFPAWDCLPYDRVSPNIELSGLRVATLSKLIRFPTQINIIITTVNAISQRVPPRYVIKDSSIFLKIGNSINTDEFKNSLIQIGYQSASSVINKGDFAVRGGIIDVFPPNLALPVRFDFFGDQIDRARMFDPITQLSEGAITEVLLCPVSEFFLNDLHINCFRSKYRHTFGANGLNDPLYEAVSAGRSYLGYEHWGPLFYEKMETLLDYFSSDTTITMDHRVDEAILQRSDVINEQFNNRNADINTESSFKSKYKPLNPKLLYIANDEWLDLNKNRQLFFCNPTRLATGLNVFSFEGSTGRNFTPERQQKSGTLVSNLSDHLKHKLTTGLVVIANYSEGSRDRLQNMLSDSNFYNYKIINSFSELVNNRETVGLALLPIESGFESDGLTVISETDIFGDRLVRPSLRKKRDKNFLKDLSALSIDDLVIHIEHGLGKFVGLEKIETLGVAREYITLEYHANDKLLIPVENIELLNRYGQEYGVLDKLGSGAWQNKKSKLKKRIFEMADKLLQVAAERAMRKGDIFTIPDFLWDEFCARFPYEETDDQVDAISDVLSDLGSGLPMDRLICGDVGFGKTEVALRAAFVVASAGMQVAIITPTTLLCRQHYKTFKERFRDLPIEIKQLSRFVSSKNALEIRGNLKTGVVDIIIGTHALLSDKVNFSKLGLVIIDEEQHFGVLHKEKLKKLKSNVHVLTLTATPIPRTLQLALSGARELSIIATPPVDRYAIRTYVAEFDALMIKDALMREHYRGGQSFFIVPRISDINNIELFLKENLPDLKICVANGQMNATDLDDTMSAFYDQQFDVLLATSIVESGLDIPSANTLIIYRADMFGLAQLYQIRGRVGRSKIRAYAYLITDNKKPITLKAEKRLKVLSNIENLGAGFSLASQDLDIRGAGNLLGDDQSGQVKEVGFELYQQMLEEAIMKIKDGDTIETSSFDDTWSPEINLNVSVLIPDDFVKDLDVRLALYRRLSSIRSSSEMEPFAVELVDRFGKLPKEVLMLINVMKIKNKCIDAGILKFDGGPLGATIKFYNDEFNNPDGLLEYIRHQDGLVKVRGNQLVIRRSWPTNTSKIKGAYSIVCDLARVSKNNKKTPSKEGASY